jgi:pyruvate kinase
MPLEEVPIIQKQIIRMARQSAKPVITATQMLRSMIDSPRPTRAEAADVANAVLDGTDALMLSEETAIGRYPAQAVRILDRIARATERNLKNYSLPNEPSIAMPHTIESAVGRSACMAASDLGAAAIVAATYSGSTARLIARFRPECPVVGLTPIQQTERQLSLSWGVMPALVAPFTEPGEISKRAIQWVRERGLAKTDDRLVVTAGVPVGRPGTTNLLSVLVME